mgnify:FL=1
MLKGFGERIKQLRKDRHLTLVKLSKTSKISASTLSRMERGRMVGTLESHQRLCKALGISLSELYQGLDDPHHKVTVKRARDPADVCRHNDKTVQRILTTGFLQKKIFPSLIEIAPGGRTTLEQAKPDVEKFCYVLSGRVRCSIGKEFHELKTGDSIYFNSGQAHQIENSGANSAKVLCVAVPLAL